uniref:Uncharacterized protein n=1 Tax=Streptomyces sp. TP-A0584 TaxID=314563 RepID=A0A6S4QP64_9ACTN|nr:hypothetical protein [Streptomyces sp. TP-A0584]
MSSPYARGSPVVVRVCPFGLPSSPHARGWSSWRVADRGSVNLTADFGCWSGQWVAGVSRPSKWIWKAFSGAFQRMVQRLRPLPVGSSDISAIVGITGDRISGSR